MKYGVTMRKVLLIKNCMVYLLSQNFHSPWVTLFISPFVWCHFLLIFLIKFLGQIWVCSISSEKDIHVLKNRLFFSLVTSRRSESILEIMSMESIRFYKNIFITMSCCKFWIYWMGVDIKFTNTKFTTWQLPRRNSDARVWLTEDKLLLVWKHLHVYNERNLTNK